VTLRADSSAGAGTASNTLTGTPYTYPDAPTNIVADGRNGSLVVTWSAPAYNGGSAITSYTATAFTAATAGSQVTTCSTSTLSCTLGGLSNGTTYYVSMQAQNAAGLSVRSDPRVAGTPSLLPTAPRNVAGTPGNGQVSLSWDAPTGRGNSAIVDYQIWYSSGSGYTEFTHDPSTATSATVTGLTNGTAYTFEVYAVNSDGTGPVSAASAPVTPATLPGAPTIDSATAGNASVALAWTPPADDGGSPVTGYLITPSVGDPVTVGNVTSYVVTGLTNGTPYTFTVAAINAMGTGDASVASTEVTPAATAPGAPSITSATAGDT